MCPTGPNAANDRVDLFVGERAARLFREGRHRGSWNSFGRDPPNRRIVGDSQKHRIVEAPRRPASPVRAVASRAIGSIQGVSHGVCCDVSPVVSNDVSFDGSYDISHAAAYVVSGFRLR
jgi:hypothetical protein